MLDIFLATALSLSLTATGPAVIAGFQRLSSADGLSNNSVYALLQDRRGFLWVGTTDGLNRFDGYQFKVYRHDGDDPFSLSNNLVHCLLERPDGSLLVGSAGGLDRFRPRQDRFEPVAALSGIGVHKLVGHDDGRVWAATERGLYRQDGPGAWSRQSLQPPPGWPQDATFVVDLASHDGSLWLSVTDQGRTALVRWVAGERSEWFHTDPEASVINRIWVDESGRIGVGIGDRGLIDPLPGERIVLEPAPERAWAVTGAGPDAYWVGTGRGLFLTGPQATGPLLLDRNPNAYLRNFVRALVTDQAGHLWVGTHGGLFRSLPGFRAFSHVGFDASRADSLPAPAVSAVFEDHRGALWVGTFGGGLSRLEQGVVAEHYQDLWPGSPPVIWDLAAGPDDDLLLATHVGLVRLDPRKRVHTAIPLGVELESSVNIRKLHPDGRGGYWLATTAGLFRWHPDTGSERRWPLPNAPAPRSIGIESMTVRDGRIWMGTRANDVVRFDPDTGAQFLAELDPAFRSEGIWDLAIGPDGNVLLATGGGFFQADPETLAITPGVPDAALPPGAVYSVRVDDQGMIWLGTGNGLVRIERPDRILRFSARDGTRITEYNRHASTQRRDGRLVFGGMSGLTEFDPEAIGRNPYRPPVSITAVRVHNREGERVEHFDAGRPLVLDHADYTFALEFAAFNFVDARENQYRYRLVGFDPDWIEAGTRRIAMYTNVPPGRYRFEVLGSNDDGLWGTTPAALDLHIRPPLWATAWFRIGAAMALLAMLTLAYRWRVRHLLDLERMRLRIADDLHDEVSSDLSGIAIASGLLERSPDLADAERDRVAMLRKAVLRTARNLKDIVWTISPEHDRGIALRDRFQAVAQDLLPDADVQLNFDSEVLERTLPMALRRDVFLVFKEAVHNVQRHARAHRVWVHLGADRHRIVLTIDDDGIGLSDPVPRGRGLASMQRRARAAGGHLTLEARTDGGTRVRLDVPLANTRHGTAVGAGATLDRY